MQKTITMSYSEYLEKEALIEALTMKSDELIYAMKEIEVLRLQSDDKDLKIIKLKWQLAEFESEMKRIKGRITEILK